MKTKALGTVKKSSETDWIRRWSPIGLILLLTTALYLYQLGTESLWIDELYSVHDAKPIELNHSLILKIATIRPLYYILLKIWMLFGTNDAWLRGLAVIFGLGSVFLIYLLGRRVAGEATGLISALLLALSPLFINFAQMVRMYSLGTCLAIGGSLALAHALEKPTASAMGCWASTRILMFLTTPLNGTLLLPDVLLFGLKFRKQRRVLLAFSKWLLLVIVFCLPSAFSLVSGTTSAVGGWLSEPQQAGLVEIIRKLNHFTAFPFPSTSKLMSLFYKTYTLMLAGLLAIALFKKHRSARLLWVAAWAFLPSAMLYLVSQRLWVDRYILFVAPYVLILLAAGFLRVWRLQRILAIGVVIVYAIAVSGGLVRYYTVQDRQDWQGIMQTISINEKPGDIIVLSGGSASEKAPLALRHYYQGAAPIKRQPELCPTTKIKPSTVENALRSLSPFPSRLWLVCGDFDQKAFQRVFGETFDWQSWHQFANWNFYRENDYLNLVLVTPKTSNLVAPPIHSIKGK
ncbi:MAG: glycosyltransferase family 39 protein [Coleofasciculus sp. D1-CHI-01]|uniref:glycosyltransferase family 39 protein n=1 Tax=Coleofasciculus sp. D1-CHI-01 TaxID=3068482 RepID=UPI0032F5CCDC